jgi:hypothetical protein
MKKRAWSLQMILYFIIDAAKGGGIFNLTDCYNPTFNELSHEISYKLNKGKVYNINKPQAKILAFVGDILGKVFPFNTINYNKIT